MALTRLDGGLGRGSDSFAIAAYRELMRKFIHAFPADHQTIDQHANFEWQMAGDIPNAVDIGSQVYEQALSYAGLCLPLKESQINFIVSRTNDWAAQDRCAPHIPATHRLGIDISSVQRLSNRSCSWRIWECAGQQRALGPMDEDCGSVSSRRPRSVEG